MLIKAIELVDWKSLILKRVFQMARKASRALDSFSHIYLLLHAFLTFLASVSILFKQDAFSSPLLLRLFSYLIISNYSSLFGVSSQLVYIILILFSFTLIILVFIHLGFSQILFFLSRALCVMASVCVVLLMPLMDTVVTAATELHEGGGTLANYLSAVGVTVMISLVMVIVKFNIRIFRRKNTSWNYSNDPELYGMLFDVCRTVYIGIYGVNIFLCLASLLLEYLHRHLQGGPLVKCERNICKSLSNYVTATYVSILLSLLSGNGELGMYIWILSIATLVIHTLLTYYRDTDELLYLPVCSSDPFAFYDFYFRFKEELKVEDGKSAKKHLNILRLHSVHCGQSCILRELKSDEASIEGAAVEFIRRKTSECLEYHILGELFNAEIGQKYDLESLSRKELNLKQKYILQSAALDMKASQGDIEMIETNKGQLIRVFYDLMYELSILYSSFYEELSHIHPKIQVVVTVGGKIHSQVIKLKSIYVQLVKTKMITFKMIQIYLAFFSHFMNENIMNEDDVDRLSKIQQHTHFEDITDSFIPTLMIYPENGLIENANAEAQKYLQSTRFELKYKKVTDMLLPIVGVAELQKGVGVEDCYSFLKRGEGYVCARVIVIQKYVKQKTLLACEIHSNYCNDSSNCFLVNQKFELIQTMKDESVLIVKTTEVPVKWKTVFELNVFPVAAKLSKTKMMKVNTDHRSCTIALRMVKTLIPNANIILAQLVVSAEVNKKNSLIQKRDSFILLRNQGLFQFHYGEQTDNKPILYAVRNQHNFNMWSQQPSRQSQELLENPRQLHESFAKGIKTYRLYEGEIYNIDLEDKEAYNDQFEQHRNEKQDGFKKESQVDFYLFVGVILVGLIIACLSIFLLLSYQSSNAIIVARYTQYQNMQNFILDFNRILSTLRDVANNLFDRFPNMNYQTEVLTSIKRLEILKKSALFTNDVVTMKSVDPRVQYMTGTLSELIDVVFAHVLEIIETGNLPIIESIHNACLIGLSESIQGQIQFLGREVLSQVSSIKIINNAVLYLSMGIMVLLNVLMTLHCLKSVDKMQARLLGLMYMTDSEARLMQENSQKLKYVIEMYRKNFDVDTQNLMSSSGGGGKRKNPKEAVIGEQTMYLVGIILLLGICLQVVGFYYYTAKFNQQMDVFTTMMSQGDQLTRIYSLACSFSNQIDHTGKVNQTTLTILRRYLSNSQADRTSLLFSNELSILIKTVMFTDSCPLISSMGFITLQNCYNTTPTFKIQNPFQMGLAIYFHQLNYMLTVNITDTFGITGIFSRPFIGIYLHFTTAIKEEGLSYINTSFSTFALLSYLIIAADALYLFVFLIFSKYFQQQVRRIKIIAEFFEAKINSKAEKEQEQEMKEKEKKERKRKVTLDLKV